MPTNRTALYFSVNVFTVARKHCTKWDSIFTFPTGDETAITTWSSEPREGPAVCQVGYKLMQDSILWNNYFIISGNSSYGKCCQFTKKEHFYC